MLEVSDAKPEVAVQDVEYRRLLGYPKDHPLTDRARELSDWARAWYRNHGRPWLYARQASGLALADGRVTIAATTFVSPRLHDSLAEAEADSAALVAVRAGRECEEEAHRL